jgi:hypothetical protein
MWDETRRGANVRALTCTGCGLCYSSAAIARQPLFAAVATCRRCGGALERGMGRIQARAAEQLEARRRRLERALAAGEDDPVAVADLALAVQSAEEVTRGLGARGS